MAHRLIKTGLILSLPLSLMADGEYAHFHGGPMIGLSWSPAKEFRGYAGQVNDGSKNVVTADGAGQLAPQLGFGLTYSFQPSSIRLGLDMDIVRVIGKEAGKSTGKLQTATGTDLGSLDSVSVQQTVVRATGKFIYSFRSNTHPGWYFWLGPTVAKAQTKATAAFGGGDLDLPSTSTTFHGAGLGWGRRAFSERNMGIFEVNLQWLKNSKEGVAAGGLTLEIRGGVHF